MTPTDRVDPLDLLAAVKEALREVDSCARVCARRSLRGQDTTYIAGRFLAAETDARDYHATWNDLWRLPR